MRVADIPNIEKLTVPEKILLVEDLWDSVSQEASRLDVPMSHREELDARRAGYDAGRTNLLTLDELKVRIESKK